MKKYIVKDRSFYKTFFSLTLIISLQQLIAFAVNLADNLMLGRFSEMAMSGASLVNQVQFLLQSLVFGITTGAVVLASQYWGKRELDPIKRIIGVATKLSVVVGLIFFVLGRFFPEQTLRLLTNDAAVIAEGARYMRIMSYTYIIYAVSNTLVMSLRSVEIATIGTIMSLMTLVINTSLNYVLIFGNFGAPAMGIEGAAIATTVSRIAELIAIFIFTLAIDKKLKLNLRDLFGPDFSYFKDYIKVAAPAIAANGFWGVAMAAQTAILGHLNATTIAANSIAGVVFSVASVVAMSSASSSSVVMGKTVGEGKMDCIKPYTITLQLLFIIIGIITGIVLFILRDLIITFYTVTPETKELARDFLTILSVSVVFSAYEYPAAGGIVAGGGDTKYSFYVDTIAMLLFTLPVSALSAFAFDWPPVVTFILLKSDQLLKCIPNGIKTNRYKWVKQLTRGANQEA